MTSRTDKFDPTRERIDSLRERHGRKTESWRKFAHRLGLEYNYLRKIMRGENNPGVDFLEKIANAAGVTIDWLLTGEEKNAENENKMNPALNFSIKKNSGGIEGLIPIGQGQRIPVVVISKAGEFMAAQDGDDRAGLVDEHINVDCTDRELWGVKVSDSSMTTRIHDGDIVIINPDLSPESGSFVLARHRTTDKCMVRKLLLDGSSRMLVPLNPDDYHPVLAPAEEYELLVVVEVRGRLV